MKSKLNKKAYAINIIGTFIEEQYNYISKQSLIECWEIYIDDVM